MENIVKTKKTPTMTENTNNPIAIKAVADWNKREIFEKEFIKNPYKKSNFLWFANGDLLGALQMKYNFGIGSTYSVSFNSAEKSGTYDLDTITEKTALGQSMGNAFATTRKTITIDTFRTAQRDINRYERNTEDSYSAAINIESENSMNQLMDEGGARFFSAVYDDRNVANDLNFNFMNDGSLKNSEKGEKAFDVITDFIVELSNKIGTNISGVEASWQGALVSAKLNQMLASYNVFAKALGDRPSLSQSPEEMFNRVFGIIVLEEKLINVIETKTGDVYDIVKRPFVAVNDIEIHFIGGVRGSYWGDFTIIETGITPFGKGSPVDVLFTNILSGQGLVNENLYSVGIAEFGEIVKK